MPSMPLFFFYNYYESKPDAAEAQNGDCHVANRLPVESDGFFWNHIACSPEESSLGMP